MGNHTVFGVLMIVAGVGLACGGVFVLTRGQAASETSTVRPSKVELPRSNSMQVAESSSEEKGLAFEKWVVKKFNPEYFKIKEWRGDKYVAGVYAESLTNPDLEVEFRLKSRTHLFAVECKWRRGYESGEKPYIVWAEDRQIENYRKFARDRGMSVFVVIGIGREPDDPAEVFIANLDRLRFSKATSEYLERFRRKNRDSNFFYEVEKPELR